jgi:hypothetical protein
VRREAGLILPDLLRAKQEAEDIAAGGHPIEWGYFLASENRYQKAGLDPMPDWHGNHYRNFALSGASEFVMAKGTRGGGSTNWVAWDLAQNVFIEKTAHESVELILLVMGATVAHANGRALNFQQRLQALGYEKLHSRARTGRRADGEDDGGKQRVGDGQFWGSQPSRNGINTIEFRDVFGRLITITTACASDASASEMTACDFFGDEVALWGTGQNTRNLLTLARNRLARQRPGKSYLISQPRVETEFYEIARAGSSKHRYVCALGEEGVARDRIAREWLISECRHEARQGGRAGQFYAKLAQDPRLHENLDPATPWAPAWAILPVGRDRHEVGPAAAMRECCRLALLDVGRDDGLDPLEQLWWGFGGRPGQAGSSGWFDPVASAAIISAERRRVWEASR